MAKIPGSSPKRRRATGKENNLWDSDVSESNRETDSTVTEESSEESDESDEEPRVVLSTIPENLSRIRKITLILPSPSE